MLELRDYQSDAKAALYDYLRQKDGNPCVVIPTAGGKSICIASVAADAVNVWRGRVLILAHVKELVDQNSKELKGLCPDLPVGVYSAFYVPVDSTLRVTLYWQTHPEKLPACIYVPFFDCDEYAPDPEIEEKLAFLRTVCDFDLAQGKAGYILTVRRWHLPETQVTVHAQRGPEA